MDHYITYPGKSGELALGLLLEEYGPLYMPAANLRVGIEGTLQRPPYSMQMWRDWLTSLEKDRGKHEAFAILLKDEGAEGGWRFIGSTSINAVQWPSGSGVTGSLIIEDGARGKGYGTEAKLLLLYHCFYILGLRKVHSKVKVWNAASLGHLIKCGYQVIGRQKRETYHEGAFVDDILLEVFREEWEPVWQAYQTSGELPRLSREQRALVEKETGTHCPTQGDGMSGMTY